MTPARPRPLRVVLHATTLAAHAAPRYLLHGTRGSYVKYGVDPQEDALRAGARPGGEGWGADAVDGELTVVAAGNWVQTKPWPTRAGSYADYYAAVRDAILGKGPNPVPPGAGGGSHGTARSGPPERRRRARIGRPLTSSAAPFGKHSAGASENYPPPAHHVEELDVALGRLHVLEHELHRLDLVHVVHELAQDAGLLQDLGDNSSSSRRVPLRLSWIDGNTRFS